MNHAIRMNEACTTLPSGTCAVVARLYEEDLEIEGDPTEIIPTTLLLALLAETTREASEGGAPRREIVECDPGDIIIEVDDSMLEELERTHGDDFEDAFAALTRDGV